MRGTQIAAVVEIVMHMKTGLALILMTISYAAMAQQITFNADSVSYKVSDSNLIAGKTDLHRKAQGWVTDNFGDDKEVVRLDDMDSGELTGEAKLAGTSGDVIFSFKVSSRDRRYECEIYSIRESTGTASRKVKPGADGRIRGLLKDLHGRMRSEKNYAKPSGDTIP